MKKVLFTALSLLLVAGIAQANPKKKKKEKTVTYNVELDCHMCQKKIEENIPFEKGFKDMSVDIDKDVVVVKFDPTKTDSIKIAKAIEELDFKVIAPKKEETKK